MRWILPGTVLEADTEDAAHVEALLQPMFLAGGIVLSQVSSITGLEPYIVQNWVKRGFLSPPQNKRYSLRQLCRILNINMLRGALPLEKICSLLGYINGDLADERDDTIDDTLLYFTFVRLAAEARQLDDPASWQQALDVALEDYREPIPGARHRIEQVLRIMLTAWIATRMRQEAESMLAGLE